MRKQVSLRIPDHLLSLADLRARKVWVNQATALRQLLYERAEAYVLASCPVGNSRSPAARNSSACVPVRFRISPSPEG